VGHPEKTKQNKAAIQNFQIHTLDQPRMYAALGTGKAEVNDQGQDFSVQNQDNCRYQ